MADIQFRSFPSDDLNLRYGVAEPQGTPRASVLVLVGKGQTIERYRQNIEEWTRQGARVTVLEWRNQGGSDREADVPHNSVGISATHIKDFKIHVADLERFIDHWLQEGDPPNRSLPRVVLAHSMGGHILMRAQLEYHAAFGEPDNTFNHTIYSAPMVDMNLTRLQEGIARIRVLSKLPLRYAPGQKGWDPAYASFEQAGNLTDEPEVKTQFYRHRAFLAAHEELVAGGVTPQWIEAAQYSVRHIKRLIAKGARLPENTTIIAPLGDKTVRPGRVIDIGARLGIECTKIENAEHEDIWQGAARFRQQGSGLITRALEDAVKAGPLPNASRGFRALAVTGAVHAL